MSPQKWWSSKGGNPATEYGRIMPSRRTGTGEANRNRTRRRPNRCRPYHAAFHPRGRWAPRPPPLLERKQQSSRRKNRLRPNIHGIYRRRTFSSARLSAIAALSSHLAQAASKLRMANCCSRASRSFFRTKTKHRPARRRQALDNCTCVLRQNYVEVAWNFFGVVKVNRLNLLRTAPHNLGPTLLETSMISIFCGSRKDTVVVGVAVVVDGGLCCYSRFRWRRPGWCDQSVARTTSAISAAVSFHPPIR